MAKDYTKLGCFGIVLIIIFIVIAVDNCNSEERKREKMALIATTQREKQAFENKFNYNLDSVSKIFLENTLRLHRTKVKPVLPIMIFEKRGDDSIWVRQYYSLNKRLSANFIATRKEEIGTFVLVQDTKVEKGKYSRSNHKGLQQYIIISYINPKTSKIINSDTIKGGEPPEQAEYRENDIFDYHIGTLVKEDDILNTILDNFQ